MVEHERRHGDRQHRGIDEVDEAEKRVPRCSDRARGELFGAHQITGAGRRTAEAERSLTVGQGRACCGGGLLKALHPRAAVFPSIRAAFPTTVSPGPTSCVTTAPAPTSA